jgi:hypothetical protein
MINYAKQEYVSHSMSAIKMANRFEKKGCCPGARKSGTIRNMRKRGEIPPMQYTQGPEQAATQAGIP